MGKKSAFKNSHEAPQPSPDELIEAFETLLRALPPDKREQIREYLTNPVPPIPTPRGGPLLRVVASALPRQQQWTAKEVRDAVKAKGVPATSKQIYNALGYFRRRGHIRQVAYGQYVVEGFGIVTSDELGVEPKIKDA